MGFSAFELFWEEVEDDGPFLLVPATETLDRNVVGSANSKTYRLGSIVVHDGVSLTPQLMEMLIDEAIGKLDNLAQEQAEQIIVLFHE